MNLTRAMYAIVSLLLVAVVGGCGKAENSANTTAPQKSASSVQLTGAFEKLKGKWSRTDGDYVLEFKQLLPNNDLDASYYNPSPIHIGKARMYEERGFTKVFVELQDVNYPGSRYTLIFDLEKNKLVGNYFQATQQMDYEVSFEKL